jgi:hypothetical protein
MTETPMNAAPIGELPSSRRLVRSTAIAAGVALLLLVTVVLPAEYGVDPTGIGRVLGLTRMGEIKAQLAREAAADVAVADSTASGVRATAVGPAVSAPVPTPAPRTDEVSVILRPNEGKEIKLAMRKDAQVRYSWTTDRGSVNYDTHADRTTPPAIKYHGYAKGQSQRTDEGVLVAAFDGMHGWFWRNRTNEVVTVTLRTSGDYQDLKRME